MQHRVRIIWLALLAILALSSGEAHSQSPPGTQCVTSAVAGGTGDAITIPTLPCVPTTTLLILTIKFANTTNAPTLTYPGLLTPMPIKRFDGSAMPPGGLSANGRFMLTSNGVNWFALQDAFTGLPAPPIVFTDNQTGPMTQDYGSVSLLSQPGLSAGAVYQMATNAVGPKNYDGIRSVVEVPSGTQVTNGIALSGYLVNDNPANSVGPAVNAGNGSALFGLGVSAVDNAETWGGNTICIDSTVYGTDGGHGRGCHGFEIDVNLSNPTTIGQGLLIIGASTANPCTPVCAFPAIQVGVLGSNIPWAAAMLTNPGSVQQGFNFAARNVAGANVDGVPNFLNYYDGSSNPQYWEIIPQGGNLNFINSASPPNTTQQDNFLVVQPNLAIGANGGAANSPSNSLFFNFLNGSDLGRNYSLGVDNTGALSITGSQSGAAGSFKIGYNVVAGGDVNASTYHSAGVAGVSCAAGTVSLTTLVVTNGLVTHC